MTDASAMLRLNPALDAERYAKIYAERGIVQIPRFFEDAAAQSIVQMLKTLPWRMLMTDPNDAPVHFSQADVKAMGREQIKSMMQDVAARARDNRGFLYKTYPMIEAYLKEWDAGHPVHQVTEFINCDAFLYLGRAVTGVSAITKADAHATLYGPGDFLTRHLDHGEGRERRAAYVLGLTHAWQPDWGGLLLFLDDKQDVTQRFLPRFNVLTIFDVRFLHTVTQVSSFAGAMRLSVTGWFRDDPLGGRA